MSRTVSQKMGLKDEMRAFFFHAPAPALEAMQLPGLKISGNCKGEFDYVHLFTTSQAEMDVAFPKLQRHLKQTGMLWVSWPKAKQLGTDLTLPNVIRIGYSHGLVESTALSVDTTWSGLKFTFPKPGKTYRNSYGQLPEAVRENQQEAGNAPEQLPVQPGEFMPPNRMSKLEVFIGTWNTFGEVLETEAGPIGTLTAKDTYRWLPGKHFIVHDVDAHFGSQPSRSMEILGFDALKQQHFARSFDDQGTSEVFVVALNGRRWTIRGKTVRFDGSFDTHKNRLSGLWELKAKKAGWQPWIELELVRT